MLIKDVHNNIKYSNWGRLEMLFIKPPFEIAIVGPTLKTPEKLSIKIPSQCNFLGGKPRDLSTA
jgi:hypothetical protein